MRVKLEMKKQRDTTGHDHCSCSNAVNHNAPTQLTTVTEYVVTEYVELLFSYL